MHKYQLFSLIGSEQRGDETSFNQLVLSMEMEIMIICECGEIINERCIFRDYIKTSVNPSMRTIGHKKCGYIFNFIDDKTPKKYSSKKDLKSLAMRFAETNNLGGGNIERFLIEVDRLKSDWNLSDRDIMNRAFHKLSVH
jgi:hypothetical protein